jgi:phosphoribosylanthranilate isomerase
MRPLKKVKIKICGVREIATIDCCIDNNVEYFGLVFFEKSLRNINLELALKLINYVNFKDITPVGVFVNKPINDLRNIIKRTRLNHVQLHGNENDD